VRQPLSQPSPCRMASIVRCVVPEREGAAIETWSWKTGRARSCHSRGSGRRFARACCALVTVASPVVMLLALLHPHGDGPSEMLTGTVVAPESELEPAAEQGSDRPS